MGQNCYNFTVEADVFSIKEAVSSMTGAAKETPKVLPSIREQREQVLQCEDII
jgi:hypothetical protein